MSRTMSDEDETIRLTEKDLPQEFILKLLGRHEAKGLWGIKNTREPVDFMVRFAKVHELSLPIVQLVVTKEGLFMSPVQCRLDNRCGENIAIRKMSARCQSDRRFAGPQRAAHETWSDGGVTRPQPRPRNIAQAVLRQIKENCVRHEGKNEEKRVGSTKPEEKETATDLELLDKYSRFDWRRRGIFFFGIDSISYGVQDLIFTRVFSMIVVSDRKTSSGAAANPFMCHAFVCESRSTAKRVTYALAAAFQAYGRSMKYLRGKEKTERKNSEEKPKRVIIELRPQFEVALNDSEA